MWDLTVLNGAKNDLEKAFVLMKFRHPHQPLNLTASRFPLRIDVNLFTRPEQACLAAWFD
jgi:hypothetical protein